MKPTVQTLALIACGALLLSGCERPPIEAVQKGYRGTGMDQINNPRRVAELMDANVVPVALPAAAADGPRAREVFQNVQVLGDLSVAEFSRLMASLTEWVAPEQGCNYCHVEGESLADDSLYTKTVSRQMLAMTRHINSEWGAHVAQTGVTCFTCHRGKNVPANVWFEDPAKLRAVGSMGNRAGQNDASRSVALTSLPYDPFSIFLKEANNIRVVPGRALPTNYTQDIHDTERTYGLMMHMSDGLGVNCTFCHNSRQFSDWTESTPQRVTAWHGIRMARDLNVQYLLPIQGQFPKNRLGPTGDVAKINCTTCHQGVNKPLYGSSLYQSYPELGPARPEPVDPAIAADDLPSDAGG